MASKRIRHLINKTAHIFSIINDHNDDDEATATVDIFAQRHIVNWTKDNNFD